MESVSNPPEVEPSLCQEVSAHPKGTVLTFPHGGPSVGGNRVLVAPESGSDSNRDLTNRQGVSTRAQS